MAVWLLHLVPFLHFCCGAMKRSLDHCMAESDARSEKTTLTVFACSTCPAQKTGSHQWKRWWKDGGAEPQYSCQDCCRAWLQQQHAAAAAAAAAAVPVPDDDDMDIGG